MGITDEHVKPIVGRFSRFQWVATSVVFGFFFGFVDTLLIACVLGWLGLQVPAVFGVPTTFTGYFFTGWILSDLAPPEIVWELPGRDSSLRPPPHVGVGGVPRTELAIFVLELCMYSSICGSSLLSRASRREEKSSQEAGQDLENETFAG